MCLVLVLLPLYSPVTHMATLDLEKSMKRGNCMVCKKKGYHPITHQRRESAMIAYIPLYPHAPRHTSPLEVWM